MCNSYMYQGETAKICTYYACFSTTKLPVFLVIAKQPFPGIDQMLTEL